MSSADHGEEVELLPISGLQHLSFCERQWGLIHLEGVWDENRLTVEGRQLHERVHERDVEVREGVVIARGVRLRSWQLGVTGVADVVELHPDENGVHVPGRNGRLRVHPVEYKRGSPKPTRCDEVQLCAQAVCLEEMLGCEIPTGSIYYGEPRKRTDVALSRDVRDETRELAAHMHELFASGVTPAARHEKKCRGCSIMAQCLPKQAGQRRSARRYVAGAIRRNLEETP